MPIDAMSQPEGSGITSDELKATQQMSFPWPHALSQTHPPIYPPLNGASRASLPGGPASSRSLASFPENMITETRPRVADFVPGNPNCPNAPSSC